MLDGLINSIRTSNQVNCYLQEYELSVTYNVEFFLHCSASQTLGIAICSTMTSNGKHVIFYCDDCSLLDPVITVFTATQPDIAIQTVSDIQELLVKVRQCKPEMILMYLHDPQQSYVDVMKQIREEVDFSTIELIVYRELPGEKELKDVFKKSFSK